MAFAPEYVTYVLNENFEDAKELFLSPLMAIHHAHLVMLATQHIVSPRDAHALRVALHGRSFGVRNPSGEFLGSYPARREGWLFVILVHRNAPL